MFSSSVSSFIGGAASGRVVVGSYSGSVNGGAAVVTVQLMLVSPLVVLTLWFHTGFISAASSLTRLMSIKWCRAVGRRRDSVISSR